MISRRHFTRGLGAGLVCGVSGCVTTQANQPDVPPGYRPTDADEVGLLRVFDRMEEKLKKSALHLKTPALTAYLKDMCCRMAAPYCPDIRVYVVRNPEFNASMASNGMMQVHTGFLLWCANESQVAAVLGHELGHYLRRHSINRRRDIVGKRDAAAFLGLTGLASIPGMSEAAQTLIFYSVQAYSREHESESDAVGIRLMARGGYDPVEAARVWERMIAVQRQAGNDPTYTKQQIFSSTHPLEAERMGALYGLARGLGPPKDPPPAGLMEHVRPLRGMMLDDQVKSGDDKTTEALLGTILRDNPDDVGMVHFHMGEMYRRRQNTSDLGLALASYQWALASDGAPPETHRSMGLVLRKLGRQGDAMDSFRTYLRLRPDADDRDVVQRYLAEG
ncbi:MAG: M48 family metalloprotease [Alphaproteobacteria bacterium]